MDEPTGRDGHGPESTAMGEGGVAMEVDPLVGDVGAQSSSTPMGMGILGTGILSPDVEMHVAGIDVFPYSRVVQGEVGGEALVPLEVRSVVLETPTREKRRVPSSSRASRKSKGKDVVIEDLGKRGNSGDERSVDPVLFPRLSSSSTDLVRL